MVIMMMIIMNLMLHGVIIYAISVRSGSYFSGEGNYHF